MHRPSRPERRERSEARGSDTRLSWKKKPAEEGAWRNITEMKRRKSKRRWEEEAQMG